MGTRIDEAGKMILDGQGESPSWVPRDGPVKRKQAGSERGICPLMFTARKHVRQVDIVCLFSQMRIDPISSHTS